MQIIIAALVVTLVLVYGSNKVLSFMQGANRSLHAWNVKRKGEKEAAKLKEEREKDVATWQAACREAAEEQKRQEAAREAASSQAATAGDESLILAGHDDTPMPAAAATILASETV